MTETEVKLEGGGRAVRVPVGELEEGDEFWGDTYDPERDRIALAPSMHYRLLERAPEWLELGQAWKIIWADGAHDVRYWSDDRWLVVRRADD